MFDLPDAKRIKRSRIFSSFSSSENEADDALEVVVDATNGSHVNLASDSKHKVEGRAQEAVLKPTSKSEEARTNSGSKLESFRSTAPERDMRGQEDDDAYQNIQVDYGFEYQFVDVSQPSASTQSAPTEPEPQTYAFNLFAPAPRPQIQQPSDPSPDNLITTPQPTYITIRSPTPPSLVDDNNGPGRLLKQRPQTHYFTSALPHATLQTLQSQYAESAISGSVILNLSSKPWPGTHLPWRILSIPPHKLTLRDPSIINQHPNPPSSQRSPPTKKPSTRPRTRPSKKRRIQHRQRLLARSTAAKATAATTALTEEEEREKRTRRNREKKVKRKMRDKAKKVAVTVTNADTTTGTSASDGDGNGGKVEKMAVDVDAAKSRGDGGSGRGSGSNTATA